MVNKVYVLSNPEVDIVDGYLHFLGKFITVTTRRNDTLNYLKSAGVYTPKQDVESLPVQFREGHFCGNSYVMSGGYNKNSEIETANSVLYSIDIKKFKRDLLKKGFAFPMYDKKIDRAGKDVPELERYVSELPYTRLLIQRNLSKQTGINVDPISMQEAIELVCSNREVREIAGKTMIDTAEALQTLEVKKVDGSTIKENSIYIGKTKTSVLRPKSIHFSWVFVNEDNTITAGAGYPKDYNYENGITAYKIRKK